MLQPGFPLVTGAMLLHFVVLGLIKSVHACTTIAFGKAATADGSPIVTYNADSGSADFRIAYIPAQDHPPGAMRPVYPYIGDYPRFVGNRSAIYAPQNRSGVMQQYTSAIGQIPQVSHTYAYWENLFPIMNEKGVVMGETTCWAKIWTARRGAGGKALFFTPELMQIALERCSTARCAVNTMGYWAEAEGFYGELAENTVGGEIVTVGDSSEAWSFHVMADYQGGAVWAGQRVPDTHASVAANNFIIRQIDFSDHGHSNFLWSSNLLDVAQQLVDKGDSPAFCAKAATFDFLRCFGSDLRKDLYYPLYGPRIPDPFYTTLRMWRVQNVVAPSAGFVNPTDNAFELPFSFPVDVPVTLNQVMALKRDNLKGTQYDLSRDALGSPYGDPNRNEGGNGMVEVPGKWARAISIIRTSYSIIGQTRQHAPALVWYTMHQPATSIYVPIFAEATEVHDSYSRGDQFKYDRESAWWTFNFVSNWMRLAYKEMHERFVFPRLHELQAKVIDRVGKITSNLTAEQSTLQAEVVAEWARFGEFLVMAFNNGLLNVPAPGGYFGYPRQWLEVIGFNESILPRRLERHDNCNAQLTSHAQSSNPMVIEASVIWFASGLCIGAVGAFAVAYSLLRYSHKVDGSVYGRLPSA